MPRAIPAVIPVVPDTYDYHDNNNDVYDGDWSPPSIDSSHLPSPITVRFGDPTSLTVYISGCPAPNIRWLVGRKRVKDSSRYQLISDGMQHTLNIAKATEDLNVGVSVVASNDAGEDTCTINIRVLEEIQPFNSSSTRNSVMNTSSRSLDVGSAVTRDESTGRRSVRRKKLSKAGETRSVTSLDTYSSNPISPAGDDSGLATDFNASLDRSTDSLETRGRRLRRVKGSTRRPASSTPSSTSNLPTSDPVTSSRPEAEEYQQPPPKPPLPPSGKGSRRSASAAPEIPNGGSSFSNSGGYGSLEVSSPTSSNPPAAADHNGSFAFETANDVNNDDAVVNSKPPSAASGTGRKSTRRVKRPTSADTENRRQRGDESMDAEGTGNEALPAADLSMSQSMASAENLIGGVEQESNSGLPVVGRPKRLKKRKRRGQSDVSLDRSADFMDDSTVAAEQPLDDITTGNQNESEAGTGERPKKHKKSKKPSQAGDSDVTGSCDDLELQHGNSEAEIQPEVGENIAEKAESVNTQKSKPDNRRALAADNEELPIQDVEPRISTLPPAGTDGATRSKPKKKAKDRKSKHNPNAVTGVELSEDEFDKEIEQALQKDDVIPAEKPADVVAVTEEPRPRSSSRQRSKKDVVGDNAMELGPLADDSKPSRKSRHRKPSQNADDVADTEDVDKQTTPPLSAKVEAPDTAQTGTDESNQQDGLWDLFGTKLTSLCENLMQKSPADDRDDATLRNQLTASDQSGSAVDELCKRAFGLSPDGALSLADRSRTAAISQPKVAVEFQLPPTLPVPEVETPVKPSTVAGVEAAVDKADKLPTKGPLIDLESEPKNEIRDSADAPSDLMSFERESDQLIGLEFNYVSPSNAAADDGEDLPPELPKTAPPAELDSTALEILRQTPNKEGPPNERQNSLPSDNSDELWPAPPSPTLTKPVLPATLLPSPTISSPPAAPVGEKLPYPAAATAPASKSATKFPTKVDDVSIPMIDDDNSAVVSTSGLPTSDIDKPPIGRRNSPAVDEQTWKRAVDSTASDEKDVMTYFRPTPKRKDAKPEDSSSEPGVRRGDSLRKRSQSADRATKDKPMLLVTIDLDPGEHNQSPMDGSTEPGPVSTMKSAMSDENLLDPEVPQRKMRPASSVGNILDAASVYSTPGLGQRSLSKEWQVVTTTTKEEVIIVSKPEDEYQEKLQKMKDEFERKKLERKERERLMLEDKAKIEKERIEKLQRELRLRREKQKQEIIERQRAERNRRQEQDKLFREIWEKKINERRASEDKARKEREELAQKQKEEKERQEKEMKEKIEQQMAEIQERQRQEHLEKEKLEQQERDRLRKEKADEELKAKQESERLAREEKEKQEQLAKEQHEAIKQQLEKLEEERREREAKELEAKERLKQERLEWERKEKERREKERMEQEQKENEKRERERKEMEKLEEQRKEQERLEELERERQAEEKLENERQQALENERLERERQEKQQKENEERERAKKEEDDRQAKLNKEKQDKEDAKRKEKEEKEKLENKIRELKERLEAERREKIEQEMKALLERIDREIKEKQDLELARVQTAGSPPPTRSRTETPPTEVDHPLAVADDEPLLRNGARRPRTPATPPSPAEVNNPLATADDDDPSFNSNRRRPDSPPSPRPEDEDLPVVSVNVRPRSTVDHPEQFVTDQDLVDAAPRPTLPPVKPPVPDSDVSQVVVYEYSEMLSFWRDLPPGYKSPASKVNSQSEPGNSSRKPESTATVGLSDRAPVERWSSQDDTEASSGSAAAAHGNPTSRGANASSADTVPPRDPRVVDKTPLRDLISWLGPIVALLIAFFIAQLIRRLLANYVEDDLE